MKHSLLKAFESLKQSKNHSIVIVTSELFFRLGFIGSIYLAYCGSLYSADPLASENIEHVNFQVILQIA